LSDKVVLGFFTFIFILQLNTNGVFGFDLYATVLVTGCTVNGYSYQAIRLSIVVSHYLNNT
jgi:hypothetical protein